ncbi:MAG: hypothetical protein GPOALKHO_001885 [Sodalis sp.]|nr:MAG: hypothetical protein GPOALKHO_001885 [Sodalis sp.]
MKLHREITPVAYKNFKCRGKQCLSNCCRGWQFISIKPIRPISLLIKLK